MQNFTINASNVLMTVGPGDCFDILNSTNVTIEGVTVRSQIYPFTQGRVTSIGTNNGICWGTPRLSGADAFTSAKTARPGNTALGLCRSGGAGLDSAVSKRGRARGRDRERHELLG